MLLPLHLNLASAPAGTSPYQFYFDTQFNVERSTLYVSSTAVIYGLSGSSTTSVTNGEQSVNGAAFTSSSVSISNGDTLRLRHTSSALASTAVTSTATIGSTVAAFVSITEAAEPARSRWNRRVFGAPRKKVR
jgi:hypothetical protein